MMKKLIALFLLAAMFITAFGCAEKAGQTDAPADSTAAEATTEAETEPQL